MKGIIHDLNHDLIFCCSHTTLLAARGFRVLGMYDFASSSNPAFIKEVVLLLSSYGAKNLCFKITDFLVLNSPAVHVCTATRFDIT